MIEFGLKILLAHFLGDFVFQPNKWVAEKCKKKGGSIYLYLHVAVHAVLLMILLLFQLKFWAGILVILISHFIIDLTKLHLKGKFNEILLFSVDQLLHLMVIGAVICIYFPINSRFHWLENTQILFLLLALVLVSYVSAVVMKLLMSFWKINENEEVDSLKNAGKYIGILERLMVFAFIVLDQWQAIGLLITAKSVLRFNDLTRAKDRKLTEYILLGTMMSFSLAIGTGVLYKYFISALI